MAGLRTPLARPNVGPVHAVPSPAMGAPKDRTQESSQGTSIRLREVSPAIEEERRRRADWVFSPRGQRQWVRTALRCCIATHADLKL